MYSMYALCVRTREAARKRAPANTAIYTTSEAIAGITIHNYNNIVF